MRLTEKTQGCFWNGTELGERMSRKATEFQKKEMSRMYRGKEIFKPPNTGWIDENVACVREWVANIFFYRKGDVPHHDRCRVSLRTAGRTISNSPSPTRTSSAPHSKKRVHDPAASYDAYDESDDTPERAKAGLLKGVGR